MLDDVLGLVSNVAEIQDIFSERAESDDTTESESRRATDFSAVTYLYGCAVTRALCKMCRSLLYLSQVTWQPSIHHVMMRSIK